MDIPSHKNEVCFSIEGNIGCGKSTLIELLQKEMPELYLVDEPVKQWQNLGQKNINMLEKYYKQPKRWGFTFQVFALFTRIEKMKEASKKFPQKIKISQRSILADRHVFSQIMKDLSYMDESEYQIFKSLYPTFESLAQIKTVRIIYLRCTPEKCFQRTKLRMRAQESQIPFEYLKLIHEKHERWVQSYKEHQVLVIDTTEDFKNNIERIHEMLRKLKEFIQN